MDALISYTNLRTLPNIFFGFNHIGGYKDLKRLEEQGELDRLLKENKIT